MTTFAPGAVLIQATVTCTHPDCINWIASLPADLATIRAVRHAREHGHTTLTHVTTTYRPGDHGT